MGPLVFRMAYKDLKFSPTVDLFATTHRKHVDRYYVPTLDPHERMRLQ